ncbi:MAG: cytochrome c [Sulfurimonadaceae bacterium]
MIKAVAAVLITAGQLFALSGEAVYEKHCASCHQRFVETDLLLKNFFEMENKMLNLKAPTINQLVFRLKQQIGDREGDREFHMMEVTEFVKDYVYYPDKQKSVCIPEVIRQFDTMASMKDQISEEELEAVSEWIYLSDLKEKESE